MFKERYRLLNDSIRPSESLIKQTIEQTKNYNGKRNKIKTVFWKTSFVAASFFTCVYLALPAVAASENMYDVLYSVSPYLAQHFTPVQKSCVDNGIEMTVVSAYIHENKAEIVVSMKDTEGNRIDETTDLYDSYAINRPFGSNATCTKLGYDSDTDTISFLVLIEEYGSRDIAGDKITFKVKRFLSGKQVYNGIKIPVDLSTVKEAEKTVEVKNIAGCSGITIDRLYEEKQKVLASSAPFSDFPVDGIDLVGVGYIDDKLHIQTMVKDNLDKDNHGYFYLKDKGGKIIKPDYDFGYVNHYEKEDRIDYQNYVFDITREDCGNYELYGYFVTSGQLTEGDWKVTFPLEKQ